MPFDFLKRKKAPDDGVGAGRAGRRPQADGHRLRRPDRGLAPGRADDDRRPAVRRAQQARTDRDHRRPVGPGRRLRADGRRARSQDRRSVRPGRRHRRRRFAARHDRGRQRPRTGSTRSRTRSRSRCRPTASIGTVYLHPGSEPDSLLSRSSEMFVPIVDATATMGDRRVGPEHRDGGPRQPPVHPRRRAGRCSGPGSATRSCPARRWAGRTGPIAPDRRAGVGPGVRRARLPRARVGIRNPALGDRDRGRRSEDAIGEDLEVGRDLLFREHLDHRPALVGGPDEEQAARSDQRQRGHPDGPFHVGDGDAAVGPVDDHRQALAAAEPDRHVAQLDGGPDGRHVRGDRHEDPVGLVEDRLVERAVGRVQVDDDDVDAAARRGDRGRPSGRDRARRCGAASRSGRRPSSRSECAAAMS